jgi:hypothetical protein
MRARFDALTGCVVLGLLASGPASTLAAEVTVAAGGGGDFTNIADAIAATVAGDTIRVTDQGAYGAFAFNSRILVSDPPGASITATVVVDGPTGTETTIDGFEFLGVGNAIFLDGGGGSAGTLNVLNCTFENVSNHGILINFQEDATLIVEGCNFDNIGENAITLFRNATVTVRDTVINNAASGPGGQAGIFIDGSLSNTLGRVITLDNTVIQNSFRGILTYRRGEFSIINNSRISDSLLNGLTIDGESVGSTVTITNSEILRNGDRGVFIGRPVTALVDGSSISENIGDGFFQEDFVNSGVSAEITILNSSFLSNGQKGIFHLTPSAADSVVVIENNLVQNNGERGISVEGRPFSSRVLATVQGNRILGAPGNTSNMLTVYFTDTASLVANNLIVGGGAGIANSQGGLSILHNTVVGTSGAGVFIDEGDDQAYDVRNNILVGNVDGVATDVATGLANVLIDYNLFFDNSNGDIASDFTNVGANNISGLDPLFADAGTGDFSLAEGSPAVGAGVAGLGVVVDIDGNPRPETPSMGAFEGGIVQQTVTVALDGSEDYTNIADAIAGTNPGAIIRVVDQGAYGAFAFNSRTLVSDPPGASITATVIVDGPDGTESTIDGFEFLGVGNAIFLDGGGGSAGTLNVLNCTFENVGNHGILLNGQEDATLIVEGCNFDNIGENAITLFRNATVTVRDTVINNAASGPGGQAGIFVDGSLSNTLGRVITLDNTVIQNSFRGILTYRRGEYSVTNNSRISDSLLNGLTIDGESVGSTLTITNSEILRNGDRGVFIGRPVTALVDGSSISENISDGFFQEDFVNTGVSAEITILNSSFISNGQKGIFHLTPSAADSIVVIEDNLISNSGERSISVEGRPFASRVLATVQRNRLLGAPGNTSNMLTVYFTDTNSLVANNLIVGGGTGIANSQGGLSVLHNTVVGTAGAGVFIDDGDSQAYDIRNNIIVGNDVGVGTDEALGLANVAIDYNLFFENVTGDIDPAFTNVGVNNITGLDPMFVDAGTGDYSLAEGSPAIGSADSATSITDDINGQPRGASPSMGAFEAESTGTPTLGDINGDDVVNVADVTALAILVSGGNPPANEIGDVNNDNTVDALDVQALAELIVNN